MKNVINYFYNFNIDNIRLVDGNYYFVFENSNFVFQEIKDINFDYQAIFELNKILIENKRPFFQIVLNRNNEVITYSGNKRYVLMLDNHPKDKTFDFFDVINSNIVIKDNNKMINRLDRTNWTILWKNKIDYFEDYIDYNPNKYRLINNYFNYFIGLGENAVMYANDTILEAKKSINDNPCVCHRRILSNSSLKQLYNPLELVIDHQSRDIAEYLKMEFFEKKNNNLIEYFDNINLSEYGARLVMARMLYPSYFFDMFEKLIENKIDEESLLSLVNSMNSYEEYLYQIYSILKSKYNIPLIMWLKKVDYSSTLMTPNTSGTSFINIDSMPSLSVTSIMLQ